MKKCALYARVSTTEQHIETQLYDLRHLATQRGFEIVAEYTDNGISGTKARRPGLDEMLQNARKRHFSVLIVAAFDRVARSTKHFLSIVDELDSLEIEFISRRENIDTTGPMGRFFIVLIGALAEAERSILVERIKSGMRRRKLEGYPLGRQALDIDHEALVADRLGGMSLTKVARKYAVSRASVIRFVHEAQRSNGLVAAAEQQAIVCVA